MICISFVIEKDILRPHSNCILLSDWGLHSYNYSYILGVLVSFVLTAFQTDDDVAYINI